MISPRNDVTLVKEINTDTIKSALKSLGKGTKAQISEATGISVATCGKILNELSSKGEVVEMSVEQPDYGRPAKSYAYNALFSLIGCVYIHTDNNQLCFSSVAADLIGNVVDESIEEITTVDYEVIRVRIASLCLRHPQISVVSVGISGYMTNGVIDQCNFHDLNGLALGKMLSEDFPGVTIMVENDTNAAAYGFYMATCNNRDTTAAFLFSPDKMVHGTRHARVGRTDVGGKPLFNLGAGFVSNGRILRGFSGFAGEIMYLPANLEQHGADRSGEHYIALLSDVVASITAIINPEIMALSGGFITEEVVKAVYGRCASLIPAHHMPTMVYRKNLHNDYIQGLIAIALETLTCNVRLVYKY
ncbi:MAG: hypothetical protein LUC93_04510 [Planctomycetaceae bacterium]|nr:hypothetical protein [Planctomycetaceae bacterium]